MNRVIFVNPPSPTSTPIIRDSHRSGRSSIEGLIWCQTNLAQLAAMVSDFAIPAVYDCVASKITYKKLQKLFHKYKPKYVVFQIIPATFSSDLITAILAKEVGATTIAIGAHAISNPKDILQRSKDVDFVVTGEADVTIRELVYAKEHAKPFEASRIPGVCYRTQNGLKENDSRPFVDLSLLPRPLYYLLPLKHYTMPFFGRYAFVVVGRGCPFDCIFCRERLVFKRVVRMKSVDKVIDEVRTLKRYRPNIIMFHAGDFTADKEWVREFCTKIRFEGVKWGCNTHLKTVDFEMARLMKASGCVMIAPGIESGSNKVLETCRKQLTVEVIKEKVAMLKKVGLEVWGYFIIGLPGETKQTIQETIDLACSLPLGIAHFGIATPYYGTDFYQMCVANQWLIAQDWEEYDQNKKVAMEYPDLKKEDIMAGMKEAYRRFYLRPRMVKKALQLGVGTLWKARRFL